MNEVRLKRVESLIRDQISTLIMRDEIKDPRVSCLLSISRVKVSNDLSSARVYISSFQNEKSLDKAVAGLNSAAGFIQKTLGRAIKIRVTPRLKFFADTSVKEGFEINQKIDEIMK